MRVGVSPAGVFRNSFRNCPTAHEVVHEGCRHLLRGLAMAKGQVVVTEEELERLLREDPKFAVQMIDADYRENIWRYIRSRCRYFNDDDVHEVYVSTLKDFIRCIKKPDFD